jgi:hypothetical protein
MSDNNYQPPTGRPVVPPQQPQPPVPTQVYPSYVQVPQVRHKKKRLSAGAITAIVLGSVGGFLLLCMLVSVFSFLGRANNYSYTVENNRSTSSNQSNEMTNIPKRETVWNYRDDTGYYWAEANGALEIMGASRISGTSTWNVNCKNISGRELFKVDITINFYSFSDYIAFMFGVMEQSIPPGQEFSMKMTCPDPDIDSYMFIHAETDEPLGSVYSYEAE